MTKAEVTQFSYDIVGLPLRFIKAGPGLLESVYNVFGM